MINFQFIICILTVFIVSTYGIYTSCQAVWDEGNPADLIDSSAMYPLALEVDTNINQRCIFTRFDDKVFVGAMFESNSLENYGYTKNNEMQCPWNTNDCVLNSDNPSYIDFRWDHQRLINYIDPNNPDSPDPYLFVTCNQQTSVSNDEDHILLPFDTMFYTTTFSKTCFNVTSVTVHGESCRNTKDRFWMTGTHWHLDTTRGACTGANTECTYFNVPNIGTDIVDSEDFFGQYSVINEINQDRFDCVETDESTTNYFVGTLVDADIECQVGDWMDDGVCSRFCGDNGLKPQIREITVENSGNGDRGECDVLSRDEICNRDIDCCPNIESQTFNWDTLIEEELEKPHFDVTKFDVDSSDLSLNIELELDYLGHVTADDQLTANFGVTYVIDFEDFNAHKNKINEPGTCQNREASSFNGISPDTEFNKFWEYSLEPQNIYNNDDNNDVFLAYPIPASDKWLISMKDNGCDTIQYKGHFTWQQLRDCASFIDPDTSYTTIVSDDKWLNLTGTFYVNIVSPFWYGTADFGYYRVYQLLSQPFVIAVSSTVYVLGSAGINLMTMTIISVYKEDSESVFKLIFMTETADYMYLKRNDENSIFQFVKDTNNRNTDIDADSFDVSTTPENGIANCLENKNYLCTQIWKLSATDIKCIEGEEGKGTDFSGKYTLGFNTQCIDTSIDSHCSKWLNDHESIRDNQIQLTSSLVWKDEICNPLIFDVQLTAEMLFYTDDTYSNGQDVTNTDHLYEKGVDTVYVEIRTNFPHDTINIFNTELINVWICTFDNGYIVPTKFVDGETMGCFNTDRDTQYDTEFRLIFSSTTPVEKPHSFQEYTESISNFERFSFIVPDKVARDTLYIHAEIEVELQELSTRRRRMLLNVKNTANKIQHFGDKIGINHQEEIKKPHQPQQEPQEPQEPPSTFILSLSSPWIIIIGCLLILILIINIIFICYNKYNQTGIVIFDAIKRKQKNKYKSVKNADSDHFYESEVNPINVISE